MNDRQNRRHQMFIRVREFIAPRIADFSETGMVRQLFDQLKALIIILDGHTASQASGFTESRQQTKTRSEARFTLRNALEAINRAARAMDLDNKFPIPPRDNDRALIQLHARPPTTWFRIRPSSSPTRCPLISSKT